MAGLGDDGLDPLSRRCQGYVEISDQGHLVSAISWGGKSNLGVNFSLVFFSRDDIPLPPPPSRGNNMETADSGSLELREHVGSRFNQQATWLAS